MIAASAMQTSGAMTLSRWDYVAIGLFLAILSLIGYFAGRKERASSADYFLAGKRLPWYIVGSSFVAANISTEHFIGMIGSACVYGICVAMYEWANVFTFSFLIWLFIPFLLASRVFTIPEFLERRYGRGIRQIFAIITIVTNVMVFLAAPLYGGGLVLHNLFGWGLWETTVVLGLVSGVWAIYGGLSSVAWTDTFMIVVKLGGGLAVTLLGLAALGEGSGIFHGFHVMLVRNQAASGQWAEAVQHGLAHMTAAHSYNRLSVFQPSDHPVVPWSGLILLVISVGIWYNALNQFMIQRVLAAKNSYHARMGMVFAGFLKVVLPLIVTIPGLIYFAMRPDVMLLPWDKVKPEADQTYIYLLRTVVPAGLRGLFLAALFAAIQSTINSVLNSTATIFTFDLYRRWFRRPTTERELVRVGMAASTVTLLAGICLACMIAGLNASLFEYIQTLNAFFAPPFAAVFLLGLVSRRINAAGAMTALVAGFVTAVALKLFLLYVPDHIRWLDPFGNQAGVTWGVSMVVAIMVSLLTAPPRAEQITDEMTVNWRRLDLFENLGDRWYKSVILWWALFVLAIAAVTLTFSGLVFSPKP